MWMTGEIVQVYSMRCARDLELEQLLFVHRVRPSNVLYIRTYVHMYIQIPNYVLLWSGKFEGLNFLITLKLEVIKDSNQKK